MEGPFDDLDGRKKTECHARIFQRVRCHSGVIKLKYNRRLLDTRIPNQIYPPRILLRLSRGL